MEIELIDEPVTAIVEYSQTEAGLNELRARLLNVCYDVTTVKGMDVAKKDRAEVRGLRTGLETMRKAIKAPALAHCKLIDDEAKRITAALLELEEPIDEAIKAEEDRKAIEKAAKEAAERARVMAINQRIADIRGFVNLALECRTAARVQSLLDTMTTNWLALGDTQWEDTFQEYCDEAQAAFNDTKARLLSIIETKQATEREEAEAKAQREAQVAALAAERAALALATAAAKEEADRIEAARAMLAKAEADRIATERAAFEVERAEFQRQKEAAAKAAEDARIEQALELAKLSDSLAVDAPVAEAATVTIEPHPHASITNQQLIGVCTTAMTQAFGFSRAYGFARLAEIDWSAT